MAGADRAPDKEVGQTREGEEPAEDGAALGGLANESDQTEEELDDDAPDGAAGLVNVREEAGGHTALGKSLHGTGRAERARVGNADDGNGDDGVEDGGKDLDTGVLDGQDERRGLGVGTGRAEETVVVGRHDQTEDEQVDDVEEGNAPEHLLGGEGNSLAGVRGLSGRETDKLGTTEGKGSDDEDTSEAIEAVLERTGVVPVLGTEVALVADTTAVDDDAEDDETRAGNDLDGAENELNLSVAADTKDLDDGEDDEEDGDPDTLVDILAPELNGNRGGCQLEGENSKPRDGVVPANGKAPGVGFVLVSFFLVFFILYSSCSLACPPSQGRGNKPAGRVE